MQELQSTIEAAFENRANINPANADKKVKETVEKINQADTLIFQTEKQLKEFGDKLSEGNKSAINSALEKLREAHKSQDGAQIDTAVANLNNAWSAASTEMYNATNNSGAAGGNAGANANAGGSSSDANNVSDVEYEEVNDNKK